MSTGITKLTTRRTSNALFRSDTIRSLEQLPWKVSQELQVLGLQLRMQIEALEKKHEPSVSSASRYGHRRNENNVDTVATFDRLGEGRCELRVSERAFLRTKARHEHLDRS